MKKINQLKKKLKNHGFCITTDHYHVTTDINFIKKFVSQVNGLVVEDYGLLHLKNLKMITTVLTTSNIKVCLHILFNII